MPAAKKRPAEPLRVFITGATGFAGRHLIAFLEEEERRKKSGRLLDITGTCFPERPEDCPDFAAASPGVKLIPLDLRDAAAVSAAVSAARPDRIFHLAAISQVKASWDKRKETIETNILGTFNLFEAVRLHAPSARILFVSSSDVYGKQGPEEHAASGNRPNRRGQPVWIHQAQRRGHGRILCPEREASRSSSPGRSPTPAPARARTSFARTGLAKSP